MRTAPLGWRRAGSTRPLARLTLLAAPVVIGLGLALAVPVSTVFGAGPTASSLYVDLDPQPGIYTISIPDGGDWHTRSSTPATAISGESLVIGNGGQGFRVSDGRWAVSFVNFAGPVVPGAFAVPTPIEEVSCGPICASVASILPGTSGDCFGAGPFTIHDVEFDPDGQLVMVDADFRMACSSLVMSGSVRFHSTRDTVALDQSADRVFFPITTIGDATASQSVTLTNIGSVPAALGAASLGGSEAGDFDITADECSSAILSVGDSCDIAVRFEPGDIGNRFADLSLTDGTSREGRSVRLIGYGQQQSALSLEATDVPAVGPALTTFKLTLTPPAGDLAPILHVDGNQAYGPTDVTLSSPLRRVFTYKVVVGTGHHVASAELRQSGWYLAATAQDLEFDVGTKTSLTLSTQTDDGVATGESASLVATLRAGSAISAGTLRIRDGVTNAILATGTANGTITTLTYLVLAPGGTHQYLAEFEPASPDVQAAGATYDLVVVAGTRPDTTIDPSTIYTNGTSTSSAFASPDDDVGFQCRVDTSDWYACTSPATFAANGSPHAIVVRAVFANGLADRTPASRPWIIDTGAPIVSGQVAAGPMAGSALVGGRLPSRVTWSGSDGVSGIDHYAVSLSTDGALPVAIAASVEASSLIRNLAPGHTYRFAVQPVDVAGNVGASSSGSTFRLAAISQSAAPVHTTGSWTTSTSTIWWGGTALSSSRAGSTLSYRFTGRSIAWVGLAAATRGKAQVYVNGFLKATIDLYSATTLKQRIVWSASFSTSAARTITIKVLGTSGRPRVDVDGFIVGS